MKPSSKADEDAAEFFHFSSSKKECSMSLSCLVSILVVFMAGAIIGVCISAHFNKYSVSQAELFFPRTMYTANCDSDCSSLKSFVSSSNLMHGMTDGELFWRASMVPRREDYPFKRVPKVAFMFMTRGPLPFSPLWDRFFRGHEGLYSVYVHTIPDYKLNVSVDSAFYGRQIPSKEVEWGSISLVGAEKRLLANSLLDFSNDRFVLLSESCIPVFNFPTVYKYLTASSHSFVESYDENSPRGRGRYNRRMSPDITLAQWRKGSEWFELDRQLAVDIVADSKYYEVFRKHCRPSCYPDEHYIPTYLNIFRRELNANRTVTWVDWSRGGPHPARFGRESITESFIRSIQNNGSRCSYNWRPTSTCFLFARKFAPSALEPLLNLTSTVMEF